MISIREIGKLFSETRKKKNITIDEAYRKSRIHPEVLLKIESGEFDKINKPYLKSFLKQYANFLELDTEKVLAKYEEISTSVPEVGFNLKKIDEKEKEKNKKEPPKPEKKEPKKETLTVFTEKKASGEKMKLIFVGVLSAILAILVLTLFDTVKSKMINRDGENKVRTTRQKKPAVKKREPKNEQKKKISASSEKKITSAETVSKTKTAASVIMVLKARGKVWVQVNEGDKMLFAGVLLKGQSKTWKSSGTLTVWTGKADVLDFIVNTRKIKSFATGVVKNIKVSDQGIRVGDRWVAELE
ncbi:MAG: DUF4115 domain-containing protein [Candidatus Omnitrophica bacterium]|nr:DUF4115 domain-containing protein [Candidatus Omnitrophota bacterium]